MIQVKSSLIKAIGYDKDKERLTVEFKKGGLYTYSGVPAALWDGFTRAGSTGKFFMENIKGNFAYESIKDVAPA